ncbi:MAG TPA: phage integrase SAM-like domain-containing protein, partial [Flavobacteriales bacterium]|nr:phage integrase SAM-like domain-containing protein [Flavobacteriales bacterium]
MRKKGGVTKCLTPLKNKVMGVYLREKKLKNGKVSLYLDVYHNGHRYPPDFLEIHINKKNPTDEDKEKLKLANEKRKAIDLQLTADNLQLINKKLAKADFIEWCRGYFNSKTKNRSYKKVLDYLSEFVNHAPLPFYKIDLNLCRDFQKFLFTKGSNNGVLHLMVILFGGLKEAEKRNYIHKNPMLLMDKSDRLKKKEIPPTSFSIEQLQKLADTPIKINPQYRQAYFFSCFSGLRWSDANCLKWDEIITKTINGVEKWFMFFEQEKTENPEYLPLSEQAIFILKMRMEERENEPESPYVFPAVKETNEKTTPVYQRVKYALKKWAKAAGI